MRPDAMFINTARGEIVHEVEMIEELRRFLAGEPLLWRIPREATGTPA